MRQCFQGAVTATASGATTAQSSTASGGNCGPARPCATRPGRPLVIDKATYARRNVVKLYFNRLKQWRGLATRYQKRAANYRTMAVLSSIVLWLAL